MIFFLHWLIANVYVILNKEFVVLNSFIHLKKSNVLPFETKHSLVLIYELVAHN